jgi:uncharacterized protein YcfJ
VVSGAIRDPSLEIPHLLQPLDAARVFDVTSCRHFEAVDRPAAPSLEGVAKSRGNRRRKNLIQGVNAMNKSLLTGVILGAAVATAGGAFAGFKLLDRAPSYAEVLEVKPVLETIKTPREVCHQETVTHTRAPKDEHKVAGTVIGAVVGGVIGNQIGSGSGKKLATVAGAAAGGYAGNRIQDRMQKGNTYTTTVQRCETIYDTHEKHVGYDVRYRLGDTESTVRMDHHPGERIPVKDGQLVLTPEQPQQT